MLKVEASANWTIYRHADHTAHLRGGLFPYTKSEFNFESLELLSGLSLKINRIMLGADVRVVNFQKIDRVIASWTYEMDKTMEWHNPLLLQFSVGYFFGGGAQKPTLK